VETHVERLERREQTLRAKAELLAGRLESQAGRGSGGGDGARRAGAGGAKPWLKKSEGKGGGAVQAGADAGEVDDAEDLEKGREALRMKQLRQKKERLSFAVERLTLQAQQKERQLRKSMAPVVGEEEEEEE
jgi:DASH complex subunit SPC19